MTWSLSLRTSGPTLSPAQPPYRISATRTLNLSETSTNSKNLLSIAIRVTKSIVEVIPKRIFTTDLLSTVRRMNSTMIVSAADVGWTKFRAISQMSARTALMKVIIFVRLVINRAATAALVLIWQIARVRVSAVSTSPSIISNTCSVQMRLAAHSRGIWHRRRTEQRTSMKCMTVLSWREIFATSRLSILSLRTSTM